MNPQIQSILTSVGMALASSVAAWAVSKGFIPGADQSSFTNDLLTLGSGIVVLVLGWIKAKQVSQPAMIKAVNAADNGVKVVASSEPAPTVSAPLK
jgi:hypothetical protein